MYFCQVAAVRKHAGGMFSAKTAAAMPRGEALIVLTKMIGMFNAS